MIDIGLKMLTKNPSKQEFQRLLSDELLEGLLSKGYCKLDERERIHITLEGTRALLDLEGFEWRTGKRKT